MIECPLKRPQPERSFRQQIPIKRLDMSQVENDAVPLGDGSVVNSFFAHHAKYLVGACACV
jgi:hypothetical protein